jgi:phosphatidylserine decarboxylase
MASRIASTRTEHPPTLEILIMPTRRLLALPLLAAFVSHAIWAADTPAGDSNQLPGIATQQYADYARWLRGLTPKDAPYAQSIEALRELIANDPGLKINLNRMIDQVPEQYRPARDVDELLGIMNGIVRAAPRYDAPSHFPMSALFVQMMYTPAGECLLTNRALNQALKGILDEWKAYLDSPASTTVLNRQDGWLSPKSFQENDLDTFVIPDPDDPHGGFPSFNAFFHKHIKPELRPIASPKDDAVVISPNDGTIYRIDRDAAKTSEYWIKSEPYSLEDMLDKSPFTDRFIGGTIVQTFLSGNNYHRFNSPVSGKVVEARVIDGFMFSELRSLGFDADAGILSQSYETSVNTRGLVVIEADNPELGHVAFLAIGITEISSITLGVEPGQHIGKGDELGYFSYGGSTVATVFEPGAVELAEGIEANAKVRVNGLFATVRQAGGPRGAD